MSFQYLLYLNLDRSEKVFWYSNIFIIFEALISYLEVKWRLIFKNWPRLTLVKGSKRNLLLKCLYITVVALVADPKSSESFYFMKIAEEEKEKTEDVEDGFGHVIKKGMKHLEGVFLEMKFDSDNLFEIPKKP